MTIEDDGFSDALSGKLDLTQYFSFSDFLWVSLCKTLFNQVYKSPGFEYYNQFFCMFKEVVLVELPHRKQNTLVVLTEMF